MYLCELSIVKTSGIRGELKGGNILEHAVNSLKQQ